MFKKIILSIVTSLACLHVQAQQNVADKIIGVVGDKIILQSQLNFNFAGRQQQEPNLPDSMKCQEFKMMLSEKLLVENASRDSVSVSDDEVENALDYRIRSILYNYYGGDKEIMERETRRTIYQTKEEFRPVIRDNMIAERMQSTVMKNVIITPQEVKEFFNRLKQEGPLPNIPASVEIGNIIMKPQVSQEMEDYARNNLQDIRDQIVNGGRDFEIMAKIYSEDPGTRDNGGVMESNKKELDPRFASATFRLQPGEVSPVIRSSFGYHIIQMINRVGDEAKFRHILIVPKTTSKDLQDAQAKLDSIYPLLVEGKMSFADAVSKVSNDEDSKNYGGMYIERTTQNSVIPLDKISEPDVAFLINDLKVGEYSKPQVYTNPQTGAKQVRILYLKNRTDPHELNLDDDYSTIKSNALQYKQDKYLINWIQEKAENFYIRIDPEIQQQCPSVSSFVTKK